MADFQFWTLIGLMAGGFGWMITWLRSIDKKINEIDRRLTIVETILAMSGYPIKTIKNKD
jgi:hypothetical protein